MIKLSAGTRISLVVAASAAVVYLGSLWNRFAMDDIYIVVFNPLVRTPSGIWQAFAHPYWPPEFAGKMYRPLVVAGFALDRLTASAMWFHFVNLVWHAGATVAVAALARRWAGETAALAAGLVFAVHPVHVEAVANVVGRAYAIVRWAVLHPYARTQALAPVFFGASPVAVRITAVAALADVGRLLLFPLTLRADYSPDERTLVTSLVDGRFLAGLAVFAVWAGLLWWTWRRGRRIEAFALGWIAIAYLPVANLLVSTGVVMAERTLYLPSVGLALALGAAAARWPRPRLVGVGALLIGLGALRTVTRVPVWKDDASVTQSMLEDSPASYRGPARAGAAFQNARDPVRALDAYRHAVAIFDRDPSVFVGAADAAFTLGRPGLADSLLARADRLCLRCGDYLRVQARAARSRGDTATADWLVTRAQTWDAR